MINDTELLCGSTSVTRDQGSGKKLFVAQSSSIYAQSPTMITKERSWVIPREYAAKAPIIAQAIGASNRNLGMGRAAINKMPTV